MSKKAEKVTTLRQYPTFEEVLQFLHGRKVQVLLKSMTYDKEGNVVRWGTETGERTYSKLVDILCGIGQLCEMEKEVAEMIERLDEIADSIEYI